MTREELKTATNDELMSELNHCGYGSYYRDYRDNIVAEIKKRANKHILNKIRAEIENLNETDFNFEGYYKAVADALEIIDKYRK